MRLLRPVYTCEDNSVKTTVSLPPKLRGKFEFNEKVCKDIYNVYGGFTWQLCLLYYNLQRPKGTSGQRIVYMQKNENFTTCEDQEMVCYIPRDCQTVLQRFAAVRLWHKEPLHRTCNEAHCRLSMFDGPIDSFILLERRLERLCARNSTTGT